MTRKERALKNLKQMCSDGRYLGSGSYAPLEVLEDFEVAIKALEQEPCEDATSRKAHNLCNSCTNIGCEFQSGIVRTQCAFYMPPHMQPDNCGSYVVQESTTKNDLAVDCISRDSAIKALDYDIKHFEFKSGVSKHMNDIAKLLNTIYETQVNNIKALSSVTPQSKTAHWVKDDFTGLIKCDACGNDAYMDTTSHEQCESYFCPNCGAKLVEQKDGEK